MQRKYINLINIDCDHLAVGVVFNWLHREHPGHVKFLFCNENYRILNDSIVILVSNSWEKLIEIRQQYKLNESVYICGVCLGPVPESITELPNFTIHSGDIAAGLLYDVGVAIKEKVLHEC